MKKTLVLLMLTVMGCFITQAQESLAGDWSGTCMKADKKQSIHLAFAENGAFSILINLEKSPLPHTGTWKEKGGTVTIRSNDGLLKLTKGENQNAEMQWIFTNDAQSMTYTLASGISKAPGWAKQISKVRVTKK